ncbi:SEC-C metal-binding domain-containing protein [Geobacillus sp. FSL W8-0032]|nr:HEAT repeat domain-containing protein [Geobacillus icigianus]
MGVIMSFLETIEPYLFCEDPLLRQFAFYAIEEYPGVPAAWVERLIDEVVTTADEDMRSMILRGVSKQPLTDRALERLLTIKDAAKYVRWFFPFSVAQLETYGQQLLRHFPRSWQRAVRLVAEGAEDDVWDHYFSLLSRLEQEEMFNQNLFSAAKQVVRILVEREWLTKEDVSLTWMKNEQQPWFTYDGILAVYALSLLGATEYIPRLASLLEQQDDDVLLDQVVYALSAFQNGEVIEAVRPYAFQKETVFSAIHVLANIKSKQAVRVLRDVFSELRDDDMRAFCFEALCHQLDQEALPEVEEYLERVEKRGHSGLIDVEQTAYGYYTILGLDHPKLEKWKALAEQRYRHFQALLQNPPLPKNIPYRREEPKIGRNDPCPCGSGKKYKKCCGK